MDEKRRQAYLELIQALLNCASGEEPQILQANSELVDAGLVQVMQQVAEQIAEEDENIAGWLRNVASELAQMLGMTISATPQEYLQFLMEVLQAIVVSNGNPEGVYPILKTNLNKLDDGLTKFLQTWATQTLSEVEPQEAESIAAILVIFGNLIQQFSLGRKASNMETAIVAYEKALNVYTREAFPVDWAMTQNNLAIAYSDRIRGEKAENLEKAIAFYQKALDVRTREAFPVDWASTHNNLAAAYSDRIRGDKAENLEKAIAFSQKALDVHTREAFPVEWATTHNNLAAAYSDRIRGDKAENLEKAIAFYQKALDVYTREAFPQNHTGTLFNLGRAYQDAQQWQEAYDTFSAAINTTEFLREEILSGDESKQKLAEEWNKLYINIVETCLQLNRPIKALEYAERSKTRNLVEEILLRDSHSLFPPDVADKLAQLRDDINSSQYQIQRGQVKNYQELAQRLQDLRQQRNQLQDQYLPVGSGFRFDSLQNSLDHDTAMIEWYITRETFLAFIITKY